MSKIIKFPTAAPSEVIDEAYFAKYSASSLLLHAWEQVKDVVAFIEEGGRIESQDDSYCGLMESYWALKALFRRETGTDAKAVSELYWKNAAEALATGDVAPLVPVPVAAPEGRLAILPERHFLQFDDLSLACMAYNDADEAHDLLSHSNELVVDELTTWNLSVSMVNAQTALRVLVLRMSGGSRESLAEQVNRSCRPAGETLQ